MAVSAKRIRSGETWGSRCQARRIIRASEYRERIASRDSHQDTYKRDCDSGTRWDTISPSSRAMIRASAAKLAFSVSKLEIAPNEPSKVILTFVRWSVDPGCSSPWRREIRILRSDLLLARVHSPRLPLPEAPAKLTDVTCLCARGRGPLIQART